jgi:Fur family transcriptional regulator, ferric uptake regulator
MTFEAQAQTALKQIGGRLTKQRKLIIHLLTNSTQQIDAESLFLLAHQADASISLATVYRTLNALADADVIQRRYLSPEHNRQYFERMPNDSVLYITCRKCQHSFPIDTELITQLKTQLIVQHKWHDVNICSCVSGLCADCHDKAATNEGKV